MDEAFHFCHVTWHQTCPLGTGGGVSGYRHATRALSVLTMALGVALIAVTAARGGGIGILLGALFLGAGAGRLYLTRSRGGDR